MEAELDSIVREAEANSIIGLGPKVRVTRVVVYEGDAKAVAATLAASLPCGEREIKKLVGTHTITVYEHSRVAVEGA